MRDFIKLSAIGPALIACIGVWLHTYYGRKVRLKIGEVEAEGRSVEEIAKLLSMAEQFQQRNQPQAIYEPLAIIRNAAGAELPALSRGMATHTNNSQLRIR